MRATPLTRLDHVALSLVDRGTVARFLTARCGLRVLEETDTSTLVGADARRGKLKLLETSEPRDRGALEHVALRVSGFEQAVRALPLGLEVDQPRPGELYFHLSEGLRLGLVEAPTDTEYELDHVALRCRDPVGAARGWVSLGLQPAQPRDGIARVAAGGAFLELHEHDPEATERPLLDHLAVRVGAAEPLRWRAESAGPEPSDVVDAPSTRGVVAVGPERVTLEYVERRPRVTLR